MKKQFLLLTLLALSLPSLSANSYSWTGSYLKVNAGYSNLKLNYSGDKPSEMTIGSTREPAHGKPYYEGYRKYTIAESISAHGAIIECACGISQEISESFGLIGELGGTFGGSSKFLQSTDALISQLHLTAGVFYHQPSFRFFTMGGLGFCRGVFGYPNAIENLQNGHTITVNQNGDLLNSSIGLTYRGSIGFDYKITPTILLGASYIYMRSKTTVTLKNEEGNFYISNHSVAVMVGIHM